MRQGVYKDIERKEEKQKSSQVATTVVVDANKSEKKH